MQILSLILNHRVSENQFYQEHYAQWELKVEHLEMRETIKEKSSRETHNTGNPNKSDIDRKLSRAGKKRQPDDIPTQDTNARNGKVKPGHVKSGNFDSSTLETRGIYKIGPAT